MSAHDRYQRKIGLAMEATAGTAEAAPDISIPTIEGDIENVIIHDEFNEQRGSKIPNITRVRTSAYAETTTAFQMALGDITAGYLFAGVTNHSPTPDLQSGAYDHVFKLQEVTNPKTFTIFQADPVQTVQRYSFGVINSLSLPIKNSEDNEALKASVGMMAREKVTTGTFTYADAAENIFSPEHLTIKRASALSGLDAADAVDFDNVTLDFMPVLRREMVKGVPKFFLISYEVSFTATLIYDARTFFTLFDAATTNAFRFDFLHTAVIGSATAPRLKIDLGSAKVTEFSRDSSDGDLVKQTITGKVFNNRASDDPVVITLRNTKSTAYTGA
jgi:hypothetical protein